ncbi:hypothetical protein [Tardiphaga sp. P5_C7]
MWRIVVLVLFASLTPSLADQKKDAFEGYYSAKLADAIYRNETVVGQWKQVQTWEDLCKSRCTAKQVELIRDSGFYAAVYQNQNTKEQKLVYRGTEASSFASGKPDVLTDIRQANGYKTVQYSLATKLIAQEANRNYPGIQCAGDSLGGGLASVGCGAVGNRSITTNPAGLHQSNLPPLTNSESMNFKWKGDLASASFAGWNSTNIPGRVIEYERAGNEDGIRANYDSHTTRSMMLGSMLNDAVDYERSMLLKDGRPAASLGSAATEPKSRQQASFDRPSSATNTAPGSSCIDYNSQGPSKCKDSTGQEGDNSEFGGRWAMDGGSCSSPVVITQSELRGFITPMQNAYCSISKVVPVQPPRLWRFQLACMGAQGGDIDIRLSQKDADQLAYSSCFQGASCVSGIMTRCKQ